ncbi:MAG: acetyl esterase/lipase [Limisphaerales bacterium]|jgi:acetyl esterase/lipase
MKLMPLLILCGMPGLQPMDAAPKTTPTHRDIEYARVGEHSLRLDLYLPKQADRARLLVWIHGGAWRAGSKARMPVAALLKEGFAIASVDYRLSPVARFPANVHDVKAAIRWLRAKAGGYGYDASKVSIAGASAGGHLVAIVGVSNGHPELEGTVGGHLDESSDVQAIVSFYGASNLTTILNQSTPHGLSVRVPALDLLLGGHPDKHPEIARLASPVFHVEKSDPPLLLIHGDQDPQMPINQSHELHGRYLDAGLPVEFEVIHGGRHGGAEFYDENRIALVKKFLDKHLNQP